jgi:hypothetical protein
MPEGCGRIWRASFPSAALPRDLARREIFTEVCEEI